MPYVENTIEEHVPEEQPQMIVIDDKPEVQFAEFDAVFDSDNPEHSDMVFEPKDGRDTPELEILDEVGTSLLDGTDFDDMNDEQPQNLSSNDYDVLV